MEFKELEGQLDSTVFRGKTSSEIEVIVEREVGGFVTANAFLPFGSLNLLISSFKYLEKINLKLASMGIQASSYLPLESRGILVYYDVGRKTSQEVLAAFTRAEEVTRC